VPLAHIDPALQSVDALWTMSAPQETTTWRLATTLRIGCDLVSVALVGLGLLALGAGLRLSFGLSFVTSFSVAGSDASSIAVGVLLVGILGPIPALLARRVRVDLTDSSLFVQNMLRSYHVDLSEVERVRPSRYGVAIVYHRDGRRHVVDATAGEGWLDPTLIRRKAGRTRSIADAITERLPHSPGEPAPML
jgi:hypothetical protein